MELLIVIVVVGILATLVVVAYNGVARNAAISVLQSDLKSAQTLIELKHAETGLYPNDDTDLPRSKDTFLEYTPNDSFYCVTVSSSTAKTSLYLDSSKGLITEGTCEGHEGYSDVDPSSVVSSITSGAVHSCAVIGGQAYCWGSGDSGRLGSGNTSNSSVPVAVSTDGVLAGKTVTAISAGNSHTCAIADGRLFCWGYGGTGQLGNGSNANSSVPVAVSTDGVLA
ncbi:MAG TPA: hypothetical protein PLY16_02875, partial [Candidatus Saccharibacteria bacterium]|nr:hypothetical protein [Candidatus Saccharibacteria bacterium]